MLRLHPIPRHGVFYVYGNAVDVGNSGAVVREGLNVKFGACASFDSRHTVLLVEDNTRKYRITPPPIRCPYGSFWPIDMR